MAENETAPAQPAHPAYTPIDTLAWGYGLVEGPRVDDAGNLYFSDVHAGGVHRRNVDGTIDLVVPKRRGVGGIVLHADGALSSPDATSVTFETARPGCCSLPTPPASTICSPMLLVECSAGR